MRQQLETVGDPDASGAEREAAVSGAQTAIDDVMRTFDAILSLSEIESGTAPNSFETLDLALLAATIANAYSADIEAGRRRLVSCTATPPRGLEHGRIEQVGQLVLVGEDRAQDVSAGAQQIFGGRDDDRIDHLAPHSTLAHAAGAPEDGELLREAAWLALDGGQPGLQRVLVREVGQQFVEPSMRQPEHGFRCLLYTSDAADDLLCVDLGGRRFIKTTH